MFDVKETLEQIGELLGITGNVSDNWKNQWSHALKAAAEQKSLPHIPEFQTKLVAELQAMGQVARISDVTAKLVADPRQGRASSSRFLKPTLS